MTSLDLRAVHEALADQIRAGIADAGKFTINAFPSTSPRPVIEVWPDADYVTYFGTFGATGISQMQLTIRVLMSGANPETEWLTMSRLLNAGDGHGSSIVDAVIADTTLGGIAKGAHIGDARWVPEDGAVEFPVTVYAKK